MSKSILIVDDVALAREVLKNAVGSIDIKHNITFAANAYQAADKVKVNEFDLIIMDIMMPDGDGFELLSILSKNGTSAKIIITSGLDKSIVSSLSMLGKLYELDIVASLEKPIWFDQIAVLVKKTLEELEVNKPKPALKSVAIHDDNFPISLVYQPQVFSDTELVFGFEVLSRWSDVSGELLQPSCFLPMIEKLGKQKTFTSVVIKKFIQDYKTHFKYLNKSLTFSINVEPSLLADDDILNDILAIYESGVDHKVVIEITENRLVPEIARDLLANTLKLRLHGFDVSIDDFGVLGSNIERVMQLPISEIKIDRKITWGFGHNADYKQFIDEAKKLASVKNSRIIYEGVEDQETVNLLEAIGGYGQQGFFHGVPMVAKLAQDLVRNSSVSHQKDIPQKL
ncbi:EAL domain-containing protein [Vibrio sp. BS-M-Sm-2]|uniref:EAL domain-containing response regulator n=1 Tax=Vibrio sp. BS-M-Sm-2 TaxID=3241167 RepID=UPI0035580EE8